MTRNKDQKRIIRQRMSKTGESYTTARAHFLSKATPKTTTLPAAVLAERAGIAEARLVEKTGRTWQQWVAALDADRARTMTHRDIARLVQAKYDVGNWWTQAVTVGYERIKGLREIGQRRDGAYEANKSRTYGVPLKRLFGAWRDDAIRRQWIEDAESAVRTATPPKAVRLQWPDGSIVVAGFTSKGPSKSVVALAHTKLKTRAAADEAKKAWAARLDALGALLAPPHSS